MTTTPPAGQAIEVAAKSVAILYWTGRDIIAELPLRVVLPESGDHKPLDQGAASGCSVVRIVVRNIMPQCPQCDVVRTQATQKRC